MKFWQVLDAVCVDDNGDPHVNNGRGKKFGDIFPASGGIEPGRNSCRVVSLGHWASSLLSLQIRHCLGWYDHLLRLYALAAAPLSAVVNMLNKREESGEECTWRGGQSRPPGVWPYASKCLIEKILPPNAILTLGPMGLSTYLHFLGAST